MSLAALLLSIMEVDHVFVLINPLGPEIGYLRSVGLTETYQRQHAGQGTRNICYCFENMFLELLWIDDTNSVRSKDIARTGLYERAQWKTAGTNPFGIAWRNQPSEAALTPHTWAFKPPYFPAGRHIDVAMDGDDHRQPMMFKSPGATAPCDWPVEKKGALQRTSGLGSVLSIQLDSPQSVLPSATLKAIAAESILKLGISKTSSFDLTLTIERLNSPESLILRLPFKAT